jgi:hypothetical protein
MYIIIDCCCTIRVYCYGNVLPSPASYGCYATEQLLTYIAYKCELNGYKRNSDGYNRFCAVRVPLLISSNKIRGRETENIELKHFIYKIVISVCENNIRAFNAEPGSTCNGHVNSFQLSWIRPYFLFRCAIEYETMNVLDIL